MHNPSSKDVGRVETTEIEGAPQIRMVGECDVSTAPAVEVELRRLLEQGRTRLVFDLQEATFLDSSILRTILSAHRHVSPSGGEVALLCRPGFVRRLLFLLEIDRIVRVCTAEEWRETIAGVQ